MEAPSDAATVELIFDDGKLSVAKSDLIARSDFFRAMFEIPMKERKATQIELKEFPVSIFSFVFDFIFDETYVLPKDILEIIDIFTFADVYRFDEVVRYLHEKISNHLAPSPMNAFKIYARKNQLKALNLNHLLEKTIEFIDLNAIYYLQNEIIFEIPPFILIDFLDRDTFAAPEHIILDAVIEYLNRDSSLNPIALLKYIRFNLIEKPKLEERFSKKAEIYNIYKTCDKNKLPRHCVAKNVNFIDENYKFTTGFQQRKINAKEMKVSKSSPIVREFKLQFCIPVLINFIKVKFNQTYRVEKNKFKIELSEDGDQWISLNEITASTSKTNSSGNEFKFPQRLVQFIRIQIFKKIIKIESFQCLYQFKEESEGFSKIESAEDKLRYNTIHSKASNEILPLSPNFVDLFKKFCETD
ncbi:hypothetical protein B4U79_17819 [Dinothrombium tinctorium]|uniref:BTB domain-containing protein n=1 Tax=Dinothrombium tinctorium TaxID=1965070 RepID=A0A443QYA4_9ACAR|nr:hypothetical protein B4U79_17819 [Dinothrombium tinctorium]